MVAWPWPKCCATAIQIVPAGETHVVHLCHAHHKAFATLKWEWSRKPDAEFVPNTPLLKLSGIYALDAKEDT